MNSKQTLLKTIIEEETKNIPIIKKTLLATKTDYYDDIPSEYCDSITYQIMHAPFKMNGFEYDKSTSVTKEQVKYDDNDQKYIMDPFRRVRFYLKDINVDREKAKTIKRYVERNWGLLYNPLVTRASSFGSYGYIKLYLKVGPDKKEFDIRRVIREYFKACVAQRLIKKQMDKNMVADFDLYHNAYEVTIAYKIQYLLIKHGYADLGTLEPYTLYTNKIINSYIRNKLIIELGLFQYDFHGYRTCFPQGSKFIVMTVLEYLLYRGIFDEKICEKAYNLLPESYKNKLFKCYNLDILTLALTHDHTFTMNKYIKFAGIHHKAMIYKHPNIFKTTMELSCKHKYYDIITEALFVYQANAYVIDYMTDEHFQKMLMEDTKKLLNLSVENICAIFNKFAKDEPFYWKTIIYNSKSIEDDKKRDSLIDHANNQINSLKKRKNNQVNPSNKKRKHKTV